MSNRLLPGCKQQFILTGGAGTDASQTMFRSKAHNFHTKNDRSKDSLAQLRELDKFSGYENLTNAKLSKHENDVIEGLWDIVDAYGALVHGRPTHEEHVVLGRSIHNLSQKATITNPVQKR